MSDKVTRIALLLVALGVSALAVRSCVTDAPPESPDRPGDSSATTGSDPAGEGLDPTAGSMPLTNQAATSPPTMTAGDGHDPLPRRAVGPPLADGTVVPLTLTWVQGTESHYRITHAISQRNRDNDVAVGSRYFADVTTRVEGVDAQGRTRVRLTMDAVRVQTLLPDGQAIDFDSRAPDPRQLANPTVAYAIKPMLAVLGLPIEFRLGANGGPVEVDGLEQWTDAWSEAVEFLQPGATRQIGTPYSTDTVLLEWSEVLFPPVLGGELTTGETRDLEILRDTGYRAYAQFRGPARATHDNGDIFRIAMRATPSRTDRAGPGRSAQERAVQATHVQASRDAYDAAWRFERNPGRLVSAEIDVEYQLWVSWNVGEGAGGIGPGVGSDSSRVILQIERKTRVELLPESSPPK